MWVSFLSFCVLKTATELLLWRGLGWRAIKRTGGFFRSEWELWVLLCFFLYLLCGFGREFVPRSHIRRREEMDDCEFAVGEKVLVYDGRLLYDGKVRGDGGAFSSYWTGLFFSSIWTGVRGRVGSEEEEGRGDFEVLHPLSGMEREVGSAWTGERVQWADALPFEMGRVGGREEGALLHAWEPQEGIGALRVRRNEAERCTLVDSLCPHCPLPFPRQLSSLPYAQGVPIARGPHSESAS